MINDLDIPYWVWLSQVLGAGYNDIDLIFSKIENPKEIYQFGQKNGFNKLNFLPEYIINKMHSTKIDDAKKIIEKCEKNNYEIITIKDGIYPNRLKNIYASPLLLYINGQIKGIDDILTIAIIGTRKCSEYAKKATQFFAKNLTLNGVAIISGMAVGIDGISLEESLNNGGSVISVLGCGLDVDYPTKNLKLKKLIEKSQGSCIISEYPPGTAPFSYNFPVRNRIISGLSVGVLVVEAGNRSGALITAKLAIEQGKDVYGVPNNIFFTNNVGTMKLLKDGAIIVTDPEDIISQYRWQYKLSNMSLHNKNDINLKYDENKENFLNINLLKDNKKIKNDNFNLSINKTEDIDYHLDGLINDIYFLLKKEGPKSADNISEKLNISINEVLINITKLELKGLIKTYPGMKYGVK